MNEGPAMRMIVRTPGEKAERLRNIAPGASANQQPGLNGQVLATQGAILLPESHRWVEVKRGMLVRSSEGMVAGQVAALVVDAGRQQVTHVLLTRLSAELDYRLVPVEMVRDVPVETLLLRISSADVGRLPRWRGSGVSMSSGNGESAKES